MTYQRPPHPYTGSWHERLLFENDNDLDVVAKFDRAAGLKQLENAANANGEGSVKYSIYSKQCSSPSAVEAVRKHLDSGVLAKLAAKQIANYFNPIKTSDFTNHGYTCIILGACAMSLGCTTFESLKGYHMFFDTYKKFMLGIFETAPFTGEAMDQIEKGLKANKSFKPGVPYDFGSKTWEEYRDQKIAEGWTPANASPCWTMNIGGRSEQYKQPRKPPGQGQTVSTIGPAAKEDMGYEGGGCGSCKKADAQLRCARCTGQVYCNKDCQKKDWFRHKACCRTPSDAQAMQLNRDVWMKVFHIGAGA